jgi:hypothetical protein
LLHRLPSHRPAVVGRFVPEQPREQDRHDVIEYLQEENRVLEEDLGGRRIRLTDTERRRLVIRQFMAH